MRGSSVDGEVVEMYLAWPAETIKFAYDLRGNQGLLIEALKQASVEYLEPSTVGRAEPPNTASSLEGRLSFRINAFRVRSRALRDEKIRSTRAAGRRVACEACGFDFEAAYGDHGRDYIEVHHRDALSRTGETRTELDRLALLCANCHRMVHYRRPWLTVDEVGRIVADHRRQA